MPSCHQPDAVSQSLDFTHPSIYLPATASLKLVSLISKFEALDALSLQFTIPSLQPAHLQISREPFRGRAATRPSVQQKKSSTFLNLKSRSAVRYGDTFSDDEAQSGSAHEDVAGASV